METYINTEPLHFLDGTETTMMQSGAPRLAGAAAGLLAMLVWGLSGPQGSRNLRDIVPQSALAAECLHV